MGRRRVVRENGAVSNFVPRKKEVPRPGAQLLKIKTRGDIESAANNPTAAKLQLENLFPGLSN